MNFDFAKSRYYEEDEAGADETTPRAASGPGALRLSMDNTGLHDPSVL